MSQPFCKGGKVMLPGFQTTQKANICIIYLFRGAIVDTKVKYAFAIIGTFFLAMTLEVVRCLALQLKMKKMASLDGGSRYKDLAIETVLFAVQVVVGYWIMLLAMLYESWIFAAIIVGLVTGHFVSGLVFTDSKDKEGASPSNVVFRGEGAKGDCC